MQEQPQPNPETTTQPAPTSPVTPESVSPVPQAQPDIPTNKSKYLLPAVVILALAVLILGGLVFYFWRQTTNTQTIVQVTPTSTPSPELTASSTENETANWKTYQGDGFSFKYPANLSIQTTNYNVIKFTDSDGEVKFNFLGVSIYTPSQYENYIKNFAFFDERIFTDQQGRNWTTDLVLGEVYNFRGILQQNDKTYVVNLQSGTKEVANDYSPTSGSGDGHNFIKFSDQILGTFEFTSSSGLNPQEANDRKVISSQLSTENNGGVPIHLCYGSDYLPKGEIIAYSVTDTNNYQANFDGTMPGTGQDVYYMKLPAGTYYFGYQAHASGRNPELFTTIYYTECFLDKTVINYGENCSSDLVAVSVPNNSKVINICDAGGGTYPF